MVDSQTDAFEREARALAADHVTNSLATVVGEALGPIPAGLRQMVANLQQWQTLPMSAAAGGELARTIRELSQIADTLSALKSRWAELARTAERES